MKPVILLNTIVLAGVLSLRATSVAAAESWRPDASVRYAQPGPVDEPKVSPRWSVELFSNTAIARGNAFSLFSNGREVSGAGVAATFRMAAVGRLAISVRAEGSNETSTGTSYEGGTKFEATTFAAGFMVDVAAHRYLRPYLQLMGGRAAADVHLFEVGGSKSNGGVDLRGQDSVLFASGAAGLRIITAAKSWWAGGPGLAFSVFAEGGYTMAPSFDLALTQTTGPNKEDIPSEKVPLGKLERSRVHARLGLAVHF